MPSKKHSVSDYVPNAFGIMLARRCSREGFEFHAQPFPTLSAASSGLTWTRSILPPRSSESP